MTRRLFFAIAAMAIAQVAVYMARPLTSYRLLGLGEGGRAVGLVAAAFALIPLFLAIPLGRHADRRHGLRLLTAGCAIQVAGCLLLAAGNSALALGAASAVLGVGHLGLALGSQAVIARESSEDRHDQHFGLLTVGVSAGQLVGPLLGGLLVAGRTGRELVPATGHAMLVAAGTASLAVVCGVVAERARGPAEERDVQPAETDGARLPAILGTRGVAAGILVSAAVLSAADVFTAYMPVLGEQRGIDAAVIGALLAVRAGASIATRLGIGTLVRKVGRRRLLAVSVTTAALALGGVTFAQPLPALFVLAAVIGAGLGFGQPLSMTVVVQLVPRHVRGTALALRLTGNRLGQVAAPAAAGAIAGSAGTKSVFWMLSSMLVASAVAVRRLPAIGMPRSSTAEQALPP